MSRMASVAMPPSPDPSTSLGKPPRLRNPTSLLTLPPELRNYIWELAFTPDDTGSPKCEHADVNLLDAKDPDKALLLTCSQIYSESRGMYAVARTRFWRDTRFFLHCGGSTGVGSYAEFCDRFETIDEDCVSRITHLAICRSNDACDLPKLQVSPQGLWCLSYRKAASPERIHRSLYALVSPEFKEQVQGAGAPVKNIPPNAPPGKSWPLFCSWYSSHAGEQGDAAAERFDFMLASFTDYNRFIFGVCRDIMDQTTLTKREVRGMVGSHYVQPYVPAP